MSEPRMLDPSAHLDSFARDNLPPRELWPAMDYAALPELAYPKSLNAAVELLDRMVERGFGERPCIRWPGGMWSYRELLEKANRIAGVLVGEMGLVPGNRVLLRAANNPMHAASWFAVMKAGGIAVGTMPLLRARELSYIIEKAKVEFAFCDKALCDELESAREKAPTLRRIVHFHDDGADGLEALMARQSVSFANVATSHDDVALIAFTSGTTGPAKGTMHFHRDLVTICDAFPNYVLKPTQEDIFVGSPPLAFTFGLGGILLFPMRFGASTLLLEKTSAEILLQAIQDHRATICFTAPTMFRIMAELAPHYDIASLTKCVSAGETLPLPVFDAFRKATGIRIIDGLGSTEMLHIFVATAGDDIRPGATGKAIPGYQAIVVDDAGKEVPRNTIGRLGCYSPDAHQVYVVPISYNFHDGAVFFSSIGGDKVDYLRAHPCGICLEVDEIDDELKWSSVIVQGDFEELAGGDWVTEKPAALRRAERGPLRYLFDADVPEIARQALVIGRLIVRDMSGRRERWTWQKDTPVPLRALAGGV